MTTRTDQQKEAIRDEIEAGVKVALKEAVLREQKRIKKEVSALSEEHKTEKNTREGAKYWKKVEELSESMVNSNQAGYNDWALAMMALVHDMMQLGHAMYYDPISLDQLLPFQDHRKALGEVFSMTVDNLLDPIKRRLIKDSQLPTISFEVKADKEGHLKTSVIVDGISPEHHVKSQELQQELQAYFDLGVRQWAATHDFEPDRDGKFKHVTENTVLNDEQFTALNDDPDFGLEKFLSGRFEYPVKAATPSP